jgi:hypothetical protein
MVMLRVARFRGMAGQSGETAGKTENRRLPERRPKTHESTL